MKRIVGAGAAALILVIATVFVAHAASSKPGTPASPAAHSKKSHKKKPTKRARSTRVMSLACATQLYGVDGMLVFVSRASQCKPSDGEKLVRFKKNSVYVCRKEHGGFAERQRRGSHSYGPAGLVRLVESPDECAPDRQPNETPVKLPRRANTFFCVDRKSKELLWQGRATHPRCVRGEFRVVLKRYVGSAPPLPAPNNQSPVAADDSASTDESTSQGINLLSNDTDPDGDTVSLGSVDTTGTKGTVTQNPDGTVTYDPNGQFESLQAGDTSTDTFKYAATDGDTSSNTATVTVSVTGLNDAPVVSAVESAPVDYVTGSAPAAITSALELADVDDAALEGATVSIATGHDAGDALDFNTQAGITGTYNSGTGVLTLTGHASVGEYRAALRSVRFEAAAGAAGGNRTIGYRVSDGADQSNTQSRTVHVDNAPTDITLSNNSVDENQAAGAGVGTLSASDVDSGDTQAFSLVSGTGDADNASFAINGDQLDTAAQFDFESKSSYSIRVRTNDGHGGTFEKQLAVTVTDVNDAPTQVNLSNSSVAENTAQGTDVGNLSSVDQDQPADTFTYSLVAGVGSTDNGDFQINGTTLEVKNPLNYEAGTTRSVRIRTNDGQGGTFDEILQVTVTDVNDAPTDIALSNADVDENQATGTAVGNLSSTDADQPAQNFTYALVSGTGDTDNGQFKISGGQLQTNAVFNFEVKSSYTIRLRTTDSGSPAENFEKQFTIAVNDINDAPTDMALSNASVDENAGQGTDVGNLSTTDADQPGDTFTYTLVTGAGDTDNGDFQFNGSTLEVKNPLNYETGTTRSIRIQTSDGHGGTFQKQFTITVNDINDAPSDVALSNNSVDENAPQGTSVGTLSSTDEDVPADTFTYTLVAGVGSTDNGDFQINGTTLEVKNPLNYEAGSTRSVRVESNDGQGGTFDKILSISVNNLNDAPTNIALSPASVAENQPVNSSAGSLSTTDEDTADTHTYSLVAGAGDADNASFNISGNTLRTSAQFDFETKSSYSVRIRTTDNGTGNLTFEKDFTVTVTNANEQPTDIQLSSSTIAENQGAAAPIGNFTTTDVDAGDTHTYTLVTGAGSTDNSAFQISGDQLQAKNDLNREAKSSYSIRVRSTDSGLASTEKQFTITVTDVNDAPTNIALSNASVNENEPQGTSVGNLSTTDEDQPGDTFTYTLVTGTGDTDNGDFQITGAALEVKNPLNYEAGATRTVRIQTSDGNGGTFQKQFTITVVDVNDSPTDIALSNASVNENTAQGTDVGGLSTSDPDQPGDTFTYTLVAGAGDTDNGDFQINGSTLEVKNPLNYEAGATRTVRIQTSDGTDTFQKQFTITVVDVNDAPTDIHLSSSSTPANQPVGTTVGTLTTDDEDATDNHSYALVTGAGDTDNAKFEIDGSTLKTNAVLASGSYSIRIETTDTGLGNLTFDKQFTISTNFDPTDIQLSNSSVDENQPGGTAVGNLTTTDPDGADTHTYTLVSGTGDADNADFQISGAQLQTSSPLNYETDATREVRIRTTDQNGGFYEESFTINLNNLNDAPTDIALSANTVAENQPVATPVGNFSTTDEDSGQTHTYTLETGAGDTDNGSFTIVGNELRTAASFNFEGQNSFSIRVRTTDSGTGNLTFEKQFTVTVTNVNEAPTDIALSNASIAENQASNTDVGDFSTTDPDTGDTHTYTLVTGAGDTNNSQFQIVGNTLKTNASFDFEATPSRSIRVRSTDAGNLNFEKQFTITITNVNEQPNDIALSNSSVAENQPSATAVGNFSTTDPDSGDTHTYALVTGTGDTDNAKFQIVGNQLRTNASDFDFETKFSYTVRVRSTDAGSLFTEKAFTITITNVNDAPTDIALSPQDVDENKPTATQVGTFSTTDQDAGETFTYTLVAGAGSADNAKFQISGNHLQTNAIFDFETVPSYSIRVRSTDSGNLNTEKQFTISVNDVNDAPVAVDESFNGVKRAIGNTSYVGDDPTDGAPDPAGPQKTITGDILANDSDQDGNGSLAVVAATGAPTGDGGTVDIQPDGDFTFHPAAGTSCSDHSDFFDYTLTDQNTTKPPGTPGTDTGRVTIDIQDCVWYADAGAGSNGNGTSASPFNTLVASGNHGLAGTGGLNDDDAAGQKIFLYPGTYTGGLPLEDTQTLFTKRHGLVVPDGGAGNVTLETAAPGGGNSQINGGVVLGSGNTIQGLHLGDSATSSLSGTNVGTATINTSTSGAITNTTGKAVDISGGTLNASFSAISSAGSGTQAIRLDNTTGTFTGSGGTLGSAAGTDVAITGNGVSDDVNFTYDGAISDDTGQLVSIADQTGGTKDFNGAVDDVVATPNNGGGISLQSNSASTTTRFDGGVNLSTGPSNGIVASSGGTLAVVDPGGAGVGVDNTITTTSGVPLNVAFTTIHDDDLSFRSISSTGATSGIILNTTTNPNGKLNVTGLPSAGVCGGAVNTGTTPATVTAPNTADCTGGTIATSTSAGISLTSVPGGATFTRVNVTGGADDGVRATTVAGGVDLIHARVASNGNAQNENGLEFLDVTGTNTIDGTTVSGSGYHNAHFRTLSGGTQDLDVTNSTFSAPLVATGAIGVLITAGGATEVNADMTGSLITASRDAGFDVTSAPGAPQIDVNFISNDIVGDPPNAVPASLGLTVGTGDGSDTRVLVQNNDIINSLGKGLVLNPAPDSTTSSTFDATANNNRIGNSSPDSGSATSNAVDLTGAGSGTTRMAITNNTIQHWGINALRIDSGEKQPVNPIGSPTNAAASSDFTIYGNSVSNADAGSADTMQINAGAQSGAAAQSVCADYGGAGGLANAFLSPATGAGNYDLQISERFAANLRFPGFVGDGTNEADIQTYIRSRNSGNPVIALIDNGISGGSACSTPNLPPAVTP
jgi:VCBS repeat-containing protein